MCPGSLSEADIDLFRPLYWLSDGYCVISPMLSDIYRRISDYPKPAALILNGVDFNGARALVSPCHTDATRLWIPE